MSDSLIGRCFKVETSYGDDRPSWFVYRRVRKTIGGSVNGWAECHRFESRCDGARVCYLSDPHMTAALLSQTEIPESEWLLQWEMWSQDVNMPWNVVLNPT